MPSQNVFGDAPLGDIVYGPGGPQAALTALRIGPADLTVNLKTEDYLITEELNGRNTFECTIYCNSSYLPQEGEEIVLTVGANRLFSGRVHEFEVMFPTEANLDWREVRIRAADWNQIADRQVVGEIYENTSVGQIVRDIITRHLTEDGVTAGDIADGPTMAKVVFPYVRVSEALDLLAEQTGRFWNIDYYKALHFVEPAVTTAPLTVTQANSVVRKFTKSKTLSQYRNVQYIDGGMGITSTLTESFKGDGSTRTWNVEYPVAELLSIRIGNPIDGTLQSLAVRAGANGEIGQFYYAKNDAGISQDHDEPVIADGTELFVQYKGYYPIINVMTAAAKIFERQSIEGGSGRYENIERYDELDGEEVVEAKSAGLLRKFGIVDTQIEFETDVGGLAIGYVISVDMPNLGISTTEFLITRMETSNYRLDKRRYRISATTGEVKGTMREFFLHLFEGPKPLTINSEQIVGRATPFDLRVDLTDSLGTENPAYAAAFVGTAIIGAAEL